jgi:hypothetical protein
MSQIPLNASGGTAAVVMARMADPDVERIARLSSQLGLKRAVVVRQAMAAGLRLLERDAENTPEEITMRDAQKPGGPVTGRPAVPTREEKRRAKSQSQDNPRDRRPPAS